MGGILVGYELARHLKSKSVFYERAENIFQLRRGFKIEPKFFLDALIELLDVHRCGCKKRNETSIG